MDNVKERSVFIMARMNPKGRVRFVSLMRSLGIKAYEIPSVRAAEDSAKSAFARQTMPSVTLEGMTVELNNAWFDFVILE